MKDTLLSGGYSQQVLQSFVENHNSQELIIIGKYFFAFILGVFNNKK